MPLAATQANSTAAGGIERVLEPGTAPERLLAGFEFVEGPVWLRDQQALLFSDIIGDTLYRWNEKSGLDIYRRPSFMANGNALDSQGRLLTCEHATSQVSRTDAEGNREVLASHYLGLELNSPNDIVLKSDGAIYFTDPTSGRSDTYGVARPQELDFQGVFRLEPDATVLTLLVDDFSKPNGLCFSLDETRLFVNDTDRQHIRVFDVFADGSIGNDRVWAQVGGNSPGVADGMKIDSEGNLYCCGSGGIHVFDIDARRIGVIEVPEFAANFTWGGGELRDLYVTASHSVYRFTMTIPGKEPPHA